MLPIPLSITINALIIEVQTSVDIEISGRVLFPLSSELALFILLTNSRTFSQNKIHLQSYWLFRLSIRLYEATQLR